MSTLQYLNDSAKDSAKENTKQSLSEELQQEIEDAEYRVQHTEEKEEERYTNLRGHIESAKENAANDYDSLKKLYSSLEKELKVLQQEIEDVEQRYLGGKNSDRLVLAMVPFPSAIQAARMNTTKNVHRN
ncbi:10655_t:CDS:1 [Paraglomus brasilianum]|uniref:10655_t:CDS:1 n=1 Tax=Paraglomus brasilianum TaxID=144538 RepID=A0A9N9A382_9GLOM|nr:10655_t:CDS:1 [Paraglomus brasilianum]